MFILAFSLDWFTTIPGILISVGVVLLIVAIVLFATGNKKSDKKVVTSEKKVENDVMPVEPVSVVEVQPSTDTVQVVEQPKFDDISVGTPGIDPINPIDTTVTPEVNLRVDEVPTEVKIEEPITVDIPAMQPEVSVYGGSNPTDNLQTVTIEEPKTPTIYGGNDPLEATQSMPKVEENHLPYGGAFEEVKIVEPVVVEPTEMEIPSVVEETPISFETSTNSVEIPSMVEDPVVAEPIEVEIPSVVEETPISFEIPANPVEIPSMVEEPVVVEPTENVAIDPINPEVEEIQQKPVIEEL